MKTRYYMKLIINGKPTAVLCGDLDHRQFTCEIFIHGLQLNVVCCRRFQVSHPIECHRRWDTELFYPRRASAQAVTDYITLNHTASTRYHGPIQQHLACCCKKHMKLYLGMTCIGAERQISINCLVICSTALPLLLETLNSSSIELNNWKLNVMVAFSKHELHSLA